MQSSYTYC